MAEDTKKKTTLADKIEKQGGYRKNIANNMDRAESLSDVLAKLKQKGGSVTKMVNGSGGLGRRALGLAIPGLGVAGSVYDALNTEALADTTDMGLGADELANVQAMRELQETQELTPERFARVRQMVGSNRTPATVPIEPMPQNMQLPIDPAAPLPASRAPALSGVDTQQALIDAQLAEDMKQIDKLDPQAQRQLRLRKLFQGQTR